MEQRAIRSSAAWKQYPGAAKALRDRGRYVLVTRIALVCLLVHFGLGVKIVWLMPGNQPWYGVAVALMAFGAIGVMCWSAGDRVLCERTIREADESQELARTFGTSVEELARMDSKEIRDQGIGIYSWRESCAEKSRARLRKVPADLRLITEVEEAQVQSDWADETMMILIEHGLVAQTEVKGLKRDAMREAHISKFPAR